jgi:hypothetical protein
MTSEAAPSERAKKVFAQWGAAQRSDRFHYVTRHSMADETAILERLGMKPEECRTVDLHWALGGEVVAFVGVNADPQAPPRAMYTRREGPEVPHAFTVFTRATPLTQPMVETILGRLSALWAAQREELPRKAGARVVLSEEDLGVVS